MEDLKMNVNNFNSICRGCLCDLTDISFNIHIFQILDKVVADVMCKYASLKIEKEDVFPKQLCQQCLEDLTNCYKFIDKCQKSEKTLHSAIIVKETPAKVEDEFVKVKEEKFEITPTKTEQPEKTALQLMLEEQLSEEIKREDTESQSHLDPLENVISGILNSPPSTQPDFQRIPKPRCNYCDLTFADLTEYYDHCKKVVHPRQHKFTCPFCHKDKNSRFDLKIHIRTHTKEKPFPCHLCPMKCTSNAHLQQHLLTHSDTRHFCPFCEKAFVRPNHLKMHLESGGDPPFTCGFCFEKFDRKCVWKKHLEVVHTASDEKFKCEHCDKAFKGHALLIRHIYTHTGEKPYVCKLCGKGFAQKCGGLEKHIKTVHEKEKPYKCGFCEKSFAKKHTRLVHERTHTGEKPFKCSVCDSGFCSKGSMKKHLKVMHSEEAVKDEEIEVDDLFLTEN